MDSDGDGRTNGEELGDPGCVWSPGQSPQHTTNITHPGLLPLAVSIVSLMAALKCITCMDLLRLLNFFLSSDRQPCRLDL